MNQLKRDAKQHKELFDNAMLMTHELIVLANADVKDGVKTMSVSKTFRSLQRTIPSKLVLPRQVSLTAYVDSSLYLDNGGPTQSINNDYDAFPAPTAHVTLQGIEDQIVVMSSLQKPKKIELIGSDKMYVTILSSYSCSSVYPFLCKPRDDLRKDNRMMEFSSLINRLLSQQRYVM